MYKRKMPASKYWTAIAVAAFACQERETPPHVAQATPEDSARIVSLSIELSELLVELELAPQIVGADRNSRALPELAACVDLGTSERFDAEAIAALQPTLVLAVGGDSEDRFAPALKRRGIAVHVFGPLSANEVIRSIHEIGILTRSRGAANDVVRRLTDEISSIAVERDGKRRLKVAWIVDRDPLTIVGSRGLLHQMLELAGGEISLHEPKGERLEATLEAIVASEPDVILDSTPESRRDPIRVGVRVETLPTAVSEIPTLALYDRIQVIHAALYRPE